MRRQNVSNQQQNKHSQRVPFSLRTSFAGHLAGILVGLLYTHGPLKKIMETCAGTKQNTFGMTTMWKFILILMGTEATPSYPMVPLRNSLIVSFQTKRWNSRCSFSHCSKEGANPNFKPEALLVNKSRYIYIYIYIPSALMQLTENHDFLENAQN